MPSSHGGAWDVSGPLFPGMWSYADLPALADRMARFTRRPQTAIADGGFETEALGLDTHTGTYLETSAHVLPGGRRLDSLAAGDLVFRAHLVRVPRKEARGWITADELERACPAGVGAGDALLVDCGWGRAWEEPGYVTETPAYAPECAAWLRDRAFRLLGVDVPCIDSPRAGDPATTILADLFARDGILLAPLRLHHLPDGGGGPLELVALPLAVRGACAAPCRAILRRA